MSLRVDLSGNSSGFTQMLNQARTQTKAFANSVTHEVGSSWGNLGKSFAGFVAGMASFEGVKRGIEWFVETGKEIKETAEQVDMSTDSWQKWTSAVSKAGLSLGGFQRVVESLRQKRTEALTDPKARAQLTRLGFSDKDITGNMDMSEFTKRALQNANGGDLQRKYLGDIIGSRGLKYSTATKYYDKAQPMFNEGDLKQAEELAAEFKKLGKASGQATVGLIRFFTGNQEYQRKTRGFWSAAFQKMFTGRGWLWDKGFSVTEHAQKRAEEGARDDFFDNGYTPAKALRTPQQAQSDKLQKQFQALSKDAQNVILEFTNGGKLPKEAAPAKQKTAAEIEEERKADPLYPELQKQREELALKEQSRQERLLDSKRGLMTIGERRDSIKGELGGLNKQISTRNANMKGEGFLNDADKKELEGVTGIAREMAVNAKRAKYQDTTDELEARKNRLQGELKEKPLQFQADSMSKVGLYSASAVAFNPLLGLQQKANQLLAEVAKNTAPKSNNKDPYAP